MTRDKWLQCYMSSLRSLQHLDINTTHYWCNGDTITSSWLNITVTLQPLYCRITAVGPPDVGRQGRQGPSCWWRVHGGLDGGCRGPGGRGAVHRVNTLTADDLWSTFLVDAAVGYYDHALLVQDEFVSRMGARRTVYFSCRFLLGAVFAFAWTCPR